MEKGTKDKGFKTEKSAMCFSETFLPRLYLKYQVNSSLRNGDGNLQSTAAAKCNYLYETVIFLY